jgi:predicted KAP-like P-loop ATPase
MTSGDSELGLLSDSSLEDPEQDQLGYSDFAENLAGTIETRIPRQDFVVGIYGPWGSGKSTILNFVEYFLEEQDEPPLIIRFNPWWFSGQADLIRKFFDQLESGLGADSRFEDVRDKLSNFASSLSNIPISSGTGVPAEPLLALIGEALATEGEDLDGLKEEISEELRDADRRIVIMIDDIDRLTQDEIKQMFRLVKSVADFPNITYILAFDQEVVINALEGEQGVYSGEEYLDKIIQLPKHVPIPEEGALDRFFTTRLDRLLHESDPVFDQQHWQTVYQNGIMPTLQTPRDAVRLCNAVETSFASLEENINFVDLVAIETLRVFYRDIYEAIRSEPGRFVNNRAYRSRRHDEDEDYGAFLDETLSDSAEPEVVKELLSYLFPRVGEQFRRMRHHRENKDTFRKRRRICHPDMFPFYFRETVPRGELSTAELDSVLATTDDAEAFAEELRRMVEEEGKAGRSKANTFLQRFSEYLDDLPDEDVDEVVFALSQVGDQLCSVDPSQSMLDNGSRRFVLSILWDLLERVDEDDRSSLLQQAISGGDSPYLASHTIGILLQEHGEYGADGIEEDRRLLEREEIEELKEVAIEKFAETAEDGKLLTTPHMDSVLGRWQEWSDSDRPGEWAEEATQSDDALLQFVNQFIRQGSYSSISESGTIEYIDPRWLEPFLDYSTVEDRFAELDRSELEGWEVDTIEILEQGIEFLDDGQDPGEFETWSMPRRSID